MEGTGVATFFLSRDGVIAMSAPYRNYELQKLKTHAVYI
jgi:hypothetical protein